MLVNGGHVRGSPFAVEVTAGTVFTFPGGAPFEDTAGVLHWIGTKGGTAPCRNPHGMPGGVTAAMSSVYSSHGSPERFVQHGHNGST